MNNGNVRTQKAHRDLQQFDRHPMEAPAEQPGVIFLEVRLPVQPHCSDRHKINIVSHHLRELVAVMLVKRRTESLGQVVNQLHIRFALGATN